MSEYGDSPRPKLFRWKWGIILLSQVASVKTYTETASIILKDGSRVELEKEIAPSLMDALEAHHAP